MFLFRTKKEREEDSAALMVEVSLKRLRGNPNEIKKESFQFTRYQGECLIIDTSNLPPLPPVNQQSKSSCSKKFLGKDELEIDIKIKQKGKKELEIVAELEAKCAIRVPCVSKIKEIFEIIALGIEEGKISREDIENLSALEKLLNQKTTRRSKKSN